MKKETCGSSKGESGLIASGLKPEWFSLVS